MRRNTASLRLRRLGRGRRRSEERRIARKKRIGGAADARIEREHVSGEWFLRKLCGGQLVSGVGDVERVHARPAEGTAGRLRHRHFDDAVGAAARIVADDPPPGRPRQPIAPLGIDRSAIGTAFLYPVSVERIALWAKGLQARGFVLVPVSAIISQPK